MPVIGIGAPSTEGAIMPKAWEEGQTSGSIARGTRSSLSSSGSQSPVWMLKSRVRDALVTSVTCVLLCDRFQTSQVSTVPKASSPSSARRRAPGMLSRIHASLVPEK